MRKVLIPIVLLFSLSSCTLWDIINPFSKGEGLSVDAEMVVGDKQEEVNTEIVGKKETTVNTADSIVNTYQTVNEQYPFWVVALLILGWVLPSPHQMWSSFWRKRHGS